MGKAPKILTVTVKFLSLTIEAQVYIVTRRLVVYYAITCYFFFIFQIFILGVTSIIVNLPLFAIDTQRLVGYNYIPPYGTFCMFLSTVPTWGVFSVANPFAIYLVPPFVYGLLSALLCVRLLFTKSLIRTNSVTGNKRSNVSTKELKVWHYIIENLNLVLHLKVIIVHCTTIHEVNFL